jgi:hypothetical protein
MAVAHALRREFSGLLPAMWALLAGAAHGADCQPITLPAWDAPAGSGPAWAHAPLSKLKRDTVYEVVREDGQPVLKATAEGSASSFAVAVPAPAVPQTIEWRWRTPALIASADNKDRKKEDAPLRVIVAFDGDKSRLPEAEQKRFARAKSLSGRDLPYATLMYIWENKAPVGSVIPSAHTTQLKMIVVESGPAGVGSWRSYRRNLVDDYKLAFGQAPEKGIVGVAVMTDTDNTGEKAEGFYGEIRLGCGAGGTR